MVKLTLKGIRTPCNPATATGPMMLSTRSSISLRGTSLLGPPPVPKAFLLEFAAFALVLALNSTQY